MSILHGGTLRRHAAPAVAIAALAITAGLAAGAIASTIVVAGSCTAIMLALLHRLDRLAEAKQALAERLRLQQAVIDSAARDDTERKRAEAALRDQVAFLSTLLDTIPSPIYYKDAAGVYLGCNRAFAAIHGRTVDEVVGRRAADLMGPAIAGLDDNTDTCLAALEDPFQVYETQIDFADGSRHDILFSKALYRQSDGSVGGLVGVMSDTTERTRHEQQIAEARDRMARQAEDLKRSNAELEQFAYVASHQGCSVLPHRRTRSRKASPDGG